MYMLDGLVLRTANLLLIPGRARARVSASGGAPSLRQGAHALADDAEHHLVGAAADRGEARVAVQAADVRLAHKAHAAPVLQAAVGDLAAEAARLELDHRRELERVVAGDVELDRAVRERAQ